LEAGSGVFTEGVAGASAVGGALSRLAHHSTPPAAATATTTKAASTAQVTARLAGAGRTLYGTDDAGLAARGSGARDAESEDVNDGSARVSGPAVAAATAAGESWARLAPHLAQNFTPARLDWPHAGHAIAASCAGADAIGFPQLLQKAALSALTVLQAEQSLAI
jgi:hypothetical protein